MCTSLKKLACNKPLRLPHSSVVIIFLPAELQMERSVQKVSKEALSFSQISTLKNLNIQRASWDSLVIVVVLITVMLLFSEAGYFLKEWVTLIYTPAFLEEFGSWTSCWICTSEMLGNTWHSSPPVHTPLLCALTPPPPCRLRLTSKEARI